jgi:hypothetical protein
MLPLSLALYLVGGLCCFLAALMLAWSFGWKARLYRIQWDYRFTSAVFALLAAVAVGAGLYASRP